MTQVMTLNLLGRTITVVVVVVVVHDSLNPWRATL